MSYIVSSHTREFTLWVCLSRCFLSVSLSLSVCLSLSLSLSLSPHPSLSLRRRGTAFTKTTQTLLHRSIRSDHGQHMCESAGETILRDYCVLVVRPSKIEIYDRVMHVISLNSWLGCNVTALIDHIAFCQRAVNHVQRLCYVCCFFVCRLVA